MEDQGYYFSSFVYTGPFWCQFPVSDYKNVLLFLVQGEPVSRRRFYDLLLGRKGKVRSLFLLLLCLQSKSSMCQRSIVEGSIV